MTLQDVEDGSESSGGQSKAPIPPIGGPLC